MSLAQPSESTTLYACPQCGVDGVFGYLKKDGDLIWYCADHRLGRFWADARRNRTNPTCRTSNNVRNAQATAGAADRVDQSSQGAWAQQHLVTAQPNAATPF